MKFRIFRKSLFSGIAFFGTVCVLSVGYSAFVSNYPTSVGSGSWLTSDEWNKMVTALQTLDTNLSNFSFSSGNVGIGTASPSHKLEISGSMMIDGNYPVIRTRSQIGGTNSKGFQMQNNAGTLYLGSTNDDWSWKNTVLTLTSNGNVGIMNGAPSDTLTVNGGVTANKFTTTTAWTAVPGNGTWTSYLSCRRIGSTLQFHGYLILASGTTSGWPVTSVTLPSVCQPSIDIRASGVCWNNSSTWCLVYIVPAGTISIYIGPTAFSAVAFDGNYPAD